MIDCSLTNSDDEFWGLPVKVVDGLGSECGPIAVSDLPAVSAETAVSDPPEVVEPVEIGSVAPPDPPDATVVSECEEIGFITTALPATIAPPASTDRLPSATEIASFLIESDAKPLDLVARAKVRARMKGKAKSKAKAGDGPEVAVAMELFFIEMVEELRGLRPGMKDGDRTGLAWRAVDERWPAMTDEERDRRRKEGLRVAIENRRIRAAENLRSVKGKGGVAGKGVVVGKEAKEAQALPLGGGAGGRVESERAKEKDERSEETTVDAEVEKATTSLVRDVLWVYEHIHDEKVTRRQAPGSGAWGLLLHAKKYPVKFYESTLVKAFNAKERVDKAGVESEEAGRDIGLDEVMRLLKEFDKSENKEGS